MKNLFLAGLLSLNAIAISAPQAHAGERTFCTRDSEYLMHYDGSTICKSGVDTVATDDNRFYSVTIHENAMVLVILPWPDASFDSIYVSEVGTGNNYMFHEVNGTPYSSGDLAVFGRYVDDVGRTVSALNYVAGTFNEGEVSYLLGD